jgi:glycerophosphoryl diester phosphodiesterase
VSGKARLRLPRSAAFPATDRKAAAQVEGAAPALRDAPSDDLDAGIRADLHVDRFGEVVAARQAGVPVIAHRGASEDVAEHTFAAYEAALDQGADGLECDVRLTADMQLVCVHDRRVNRTSNGRGVVSTLELAQLRELDFGSWKVPLDEYEVPDRRREGKHRVLTLERLLELVVEHPRRVELAIETKHPTRYAGLVEEHLVALLDKFGLAHPRLGESSPVRVMSFSPLSVRRIRRMAPSLETVLLLDRVPLRLRDGSLPRGVRIAGPGIHILRVHPEYVARVHSMGHRVHVWTVDQPSDIDLCVELGVDAIITNRPRQVLERLGRSGHPGSATPHRGVIELNPDSPA